MERWWLVWKGGGLFGKVAAWMERQWLVLKGGGFDGKVVACLKGFGLFGKVVDWMAYGVKCWRISAETEPPYKLIRR